MYPNLAIAELLSQDIKDLEIFYIGSKKGIEADLVKKAGITFYCISTGKLRRYFDLRNFLDFFKVPIGAMQSLNLLHRIKPDLVFSKGGFVSFPVVFAANILNIPIIIHESDSIPGLTTKLCAPYARKILLGYKECENYLNNHKEKTEYVGNPVRQEIYKGNKKTALKITGFTGLRPVLLALGGSGGSAFINQMINKEKNQLIKKYDIIHIVGAKNGKHKKEKHYFAIPYANEEMKEFYSISSCAVSRAGANVLAELQTLQIPSILFPLGLNASRGDQIENAKSLTAFQPAIFKLGDSHLSLSHQLQTLPVRKAHFAKNQSVEKIVKIIKSFI